MTRGDVREPASAYLAEIARSGRLSRGDQLRLARFVLEGRQAAVLLGCLQDADVRGHLCGALRRGRAARRRLVDGNLGLVAFVARQHTDGPLGLLELVLEGRRGLCYAVDHFDWGRGKRFAPFALRWIGQFVDEAIADATGDGGTGPGAPPRAWRARGHEVPMPRVPTQQR